MHSPCDVPACSSLERGCAAASAVTRYQVPGIQHDNDSYSTRIQVGVRLLCKAGPIVCVYQVDQFFFFYHFYFPAQLLIVEGFTFSDLMDKPWSQASPLLPPGTCLHFYRA